MINKLIQLIAYNINYIKRDTKLPIFDKMAKSKKSRKQLYHVKSRIKTKKPWTFAENRLYAQSLKLNRNAFDTEAARREIKVFKKLAQCIGSKTALQVKSHHQKMMKRFKNEIEEIIQQFSFEFPTEASENMTSVTDAEKSLNFMHYNTRGSNTKENKLIDSKAQERTKKKMPEERIEEEIGQYASLSNARQVYPDQ